MIGPANGCEVEGCERPRNSRGLCRGHYSRLRKHGTPTPEGQPRLITPNRPVSTAPEGRPCSVRGCTTRTRGGGMCSAHQRRKKRHGTPTPDHLPVSTQIEAPCDYDGCDKEARILGLCNGHYTLVRHEPKLEHMLLQKDRAERCMYPDCEWPQYAQGLCRHHSEAACRGTLRMPDDETRTLRGFGARMRLLRAMNNYTLEDLGSRMDLSRERIRQLERETEPPSPRICNAVARGLGVDVPTLLGQSLGTRNDSPCPACKGTGRQQGPTASAPGHGTAKAQG